MKEFNPLKPIPAIWKHHLDAANQVLQALESGTYCALLGPRFSGKTSVVDYIQAVLESSSRLCIKIDLYEVEASSKKGFFAWLMRSIASQVAQLTEYQSPIPLEEPSSTVFRGFLANSLEHLERDLILMIDHLESLPIDLVQSLLISLRAIAMEQVDKEHKVIVILSGALSLASITAGQISPLYGIIRRVFVGDLDEAESKELVISYTSSEAISVSPEAYLLIAHTANGNVDLIKRICVRCLQMTVKYASKRLSVLSVQRAIREFIRDEAPNYPPLREAIRLVEEDPDLLNCVLRLLDREDVPRQELPLPVSPDIDPLYLTGIVRKIGEDRYQLRNEIYRQYLAQYFDPGRVGHLLTMAGHWDAAIDHLATSIHSGNLKYRTDLIAAALNSMYTAVSIEKAAYYFIRGLSVAFDIVEAKVWLLAQEGKFLRMIEQIGMTVEGALSIGREISLDDDRLEVRAYREGCMMRGRQNDRCIKQAMPIVMPGNRSIGVVTFCNPQLNDERIGQRKREYELQLQGYINQAARAFNEVNSRQKREILYRERDEQLEQKTRLLMLLHRVSTMVQTMTDLEKILHLILTGITAHFGLRFNRVWLFLVDRAFTRVNGRMGIGNFTHEEAFGAWERAAWFSFEEYVELLLNGEVGQAETDQPTRQLEIPISENANDLFSQALYKHHVFGWTATEVNWPTLPTAFRQRFEPGDMIIVPLVAQNKCLGLIAVDNKFVPRTVTDTDEEILKTFANQAATAIFSMHEREQEKRRMALEETLREVSMIVGSSLKLDGVLTRILEQMGKVIPFDSASIQLVNDQHTTLKIIASQGFDEPAGVEKISFPLDAAYPNGEVFRLQKPLRYRDVREHFPHFSEHKYHATHVRAWLGAPLMNGSHVIGVITLDSETPNYYSQEHERLALLFAGQAAVAIENVRLFEKSKQWGEQLDAMGNIALDIARRLEIKDLLRTIIERASELVKGCGGGIYLWNPFTESFRLEAVFNLPDRFQSVSVEKDKGVIWHVFQRRQPYAVENYQNWPERLSIFDEYHLTSVVGAPIVSGERFLGVIAVHDTAGERVFGDFEKELLFRIGHHAAVALENARAYESEQEARDHLSRLLGSSLDGIIAVDDEGWITIFNEGAERITGYTRNEVFYKQIHVEKIYGDPQVPRTIKRLLCANEKLDNYETTVLSKDGEKVPIILSATVLHDKQGKLDGSAGFFKDLRPLKKAESDLRMVLNTIGTMAQAENAETGLNALAEKMVGALPISFCHIMIMNKSEGRLEIKAAYPVPRPNGSIINWNPRIGEEIDLSQATLMQQHLLEQPKVFRKGELVEDIDVVQHIQETVKIEGTLHSVLIIPLETRGEVFGICTLGEMREWERSPFAKEKVEMAVSMATQGAILIDRMQAHEATERKLTEVERLRVLGQELVNASPINPKEILNKVAQAACEVIGASNAVIYPWDKEKRSYEHTNIAHFGLRQEKTFSPKMRNDTRNMTRVVSKKGVVVVDDTQKGWDRSGENKIIARPGGFLELEGVQAFVGIALRIGDEPLGALFVNLPKPHYFTKGELETMRLFANQAAIAINNAHLYEAMIERLEESRMLQKVGTSLTETIELKGVLNRVVQAAFELIHADEANLLFFDAPRDEFLIEALTSDGPEHLLSSYQTSVRQRNGFTYEIIKKGKLIVIPDTRLEPRMNEIAVKKGRRTMVGVPLIGRKGPVGVLWVNWKNLRLITEDEEKLLAALASQAAIAIENASLIDQLESENLLRTEESEALQKVGVSLTETVELNAVLDRMMQAAIKLTQADEGSILLYDQAKEEFLLEALMSKGIDQPLQPYVTTARPKRGLAYEIIKSGKPIAIPDTEQDPRISQVAIAKGRRAMVGVPLISHDGPVGVLWVNWISPRHLSERESGLLMAIASQATVAIQGARRYAEIRESAHLREGLLEAAHSITALREPAEVLQSVADNIKKALNCDIVTLYTYNPKDERIGFPAYVAGVLKHHEGLGKLGLVSRFSVVRKLIDLGEAHFVDDARQDQIMVSDSYERKREIPPFVEREKICSSAGIPLFVGSEIVGILFVNFRSPHSFKPHEQEAIQLFANQAAMAVHNAKLFEAIQRRTKHLKAVHEAGRVITGSIGLDQRQILDKILKQAIGSVTGVVGRKATIGMIYRMDAHNNQLVLESIYTTGNRADEVAVLGKKLPLDKEIAKDGRIGVTGRAAINKKSQLVPDVSLDNDYIAYNISTKSELAVPLLSNSTVVGVLNVSSDELNAFDEDDIEALELSADFAVVALENAKRYEDLEKTKDYLLASEAVAWLGLFGADWQHSISQKSFSIGNYIDGLRRWLRRVEISPEVVNEIRRVLEEIEGVAESIKDVKFISLVPVDGVRESSKPTLIDDELPSIVKRWSNTRSDIKTSFELNCPEVKVKMPPQWLGVALEKLINNSLKAMPGRGELTLITNIVSNQVHIIIKDTGDGIPEDARPYFLKRTVPRDKSDAGTGMGSLIARFVALSHGGDLTLIRTQPNFGTELLMTLPRAEE